MFLDADDRLLPGAFDRFRDALARFGEIDLIYGGRVMVAPDGTESVERPMPLSADRGRDFADYVRKRRPEIGPGAAIVHRRVFERVRFPESIRLAEDLVFYAQVLALCDCAAFPDPVVENHSDERRAVGRTIRRKRERLDSVDLLFDPAVLRPSSPS